MKNLVAEKKNIKQKATDKLEKALNVIMYLWNAEWNEMKNDPRSCERNLRGKFTSRCRCDALTSWHW